MPTAAHREVTALARPAAPDSDPPREELARHYQGYRHRFMQPAAVSFEHLYFDPARRGDATAAASQALAALGKAGAADPAPVRRRRVRLACDDEAPIAARAGTPAGRGLRDRGVRRPDRPLARTCTVAAGCSPGAGHRTRARRLPPFDEVEKQLRADWLTQETRGLRGAALTLLPRYEISLPPEMRQTLAAAPALAPFLERAR